MAQFFSGSKLTIKEFFLIIYLWCKREPAFSTIKHCPEINHKAIYKWYSTVREIVKQANNLHPPCFKQNVSAGIQIDETLIGKRRKYNKGKYFKQEWLFGMSKRIIWKRIICVTLLEWKIVTRKFSFRSLQAMQILHQSLK